MSSRVKLISRETDLSCESDRRKGRGFLLWVKVEASGRWSHCLGCACRERGTLIRIDLVLFLNGAKYHQSWTVLFATHFVTNNTPQITVGVPPRCPLRCYEVWQICFSQRFTKEETFSIGQMSRNTLHRCVRSIVRERLLFSWRFKCLKFTFTGPVSHSHVLPSEFVSCTGNRLRQ